MWKEIKKELTLSIDSKSYFFFIPYILLCVFYIYKKENDRSILVMLPFVNPMIISVHFHYMRKNNIHYEKDILSYAIAARYMYYVFITVVEYLFGVFFSIIGRNPLQGGDITLSEGFYLVVILSMTMGAVLIPYMYAKDDESIIQRMIRIYIKLVIGLAVILFITSFFSSTIDNISLSATTIHKLTIAAFMLSIMSFIAFVCSYYISRKRAMKKLIVLCNNTHR